MQDNTITHYIREVVDHMPADWLRLTTHRLDIYDESQAKTAFLDQFEELYTAGKSDSASLASLPTAYDYIRLGHPLSCVLEWTIAKHLSIETAAVISFSSTTTPILAVLRQNLLDNKDTLILHSGDLPTVFDEATIRRVYGYSFEVRQLADLTDVPDFDGSIIVVSSEPATDAPATDAAVDFYIHLYPQLGSVLVVHGAANQDYIPKIQHVRRRETIAMTPADSLVALQRLVGVEVSATHVVDAAVSKATVQQAIRDITGVTGQPQVGSSGLSIQYAIMMGLIDYAMHEHTGKAIKIVVPPNCYGGTNDQARRVAACLPSVEIVDLPVDGDHDMVQSVDTVLAAIASADAVPFIIAEIPTNPRVEVPDLDSLRAVLNQERTTASGDIAVAPVFILDQTFCPNVLFLGEGKVLSGVRAISYASGSKFPSGGRCTAGYCVGNEKASALMDRIASHLMLCDNEATDQQLAILAEQLPSMNQRIADAYANTRAFVSYIEEKLPAAKINFVSPELAAAGFTPSVFSLDLPTVGDSEEEREQYKRALNHRLITMMITKIPHESKYCVSYGQLSGCYWTIPATSTQGTTKEGDKDYIARVALSPDMDLALHQSVFAEFVASI